MLDMIANRMCFALKEYIRMRYKGLRENGLLKL